MIKSKLLAKALFELVEEKAPDIEEKFFSFMKKNRLESQIPSVLYRLDKIIEQDREKRGVQIEVPHDLTDNTKKEIKKFLKAEHLDDYVKLRKDLIAGFRAKWDGKMYDSSLESALRRLEKSLTAR